MKYTEKEKQEIGKIINLYKDYLESDKSCIAIAETKFGYILLEKTSEKYEDYALEVIEDAAELLEKILNEIRLDFEWEHRVPGHEFGDLPEDVLAMLPAYMEPWLQRVPEKYRHAERE